MRFDITVGYEMKASNSFGKKETLQASSTYSIESDTKENAIEIARNKVKEEITKVSVCVRG